MNRFRHFIEWQAFGVCSAIGEKMGIATSKPDLAAIRAQLDPAKLADESIPLKSFLPS